MVRSVDIFFTSGESFINYCSDNDFNYTIYIGQKCKVLRNGKCFIGTLYDVDSNKNTFSIKQNNGEIIEINCADVEEIFSEEEIGTINQNLIQQERISYEEYTNKKNYLYDYVNNERRDKFTGWMFDCNDTCLCLHGKWLGFI